MPHALSSRVDHAESNTTLHTLQDTVPIIHIPLCERWKRQNRQDQ